MAGTNPFNHLLKKVSVQGKDYSYYDIPALGPQYGNYKKMYYLYKCIYCYIINDSF